MKKLFTLLLILAFIGAQAQDRKRVRDFELETNPSNDLSLLIDGISYGENGPFKRVDLLGLKTWILTDFTALESDPVYSAWNKSTGISITISQISDFGNYLTSYTETDPIYSAWNKSTGILITESQISDFGSYLTSYTETDPVFSAWSEADPIYSAWNKSTGISILESQISDFGNYLTSYTETDPIFSAWSEADPIFTAWNKSTGISILESQISDFGSYLTSFTELDPIFDAWDKSTGISITESQISDLKTYYYSANSNQSTVDWTAKNLTAKTQTNTVLSGAKTASFTHDAQLGDIGAYTLSTSGVVTISIHNLSSGMQGTIFCDIATNPSDIIINPYSDAGTTGLTKVELGSALANAANKSTSFTYTCVNNGTETLVYIIYGQEL